MARELRTWDEIKDLAYLVAYRAQEAWAEELDENGFNKSGNNQHGIDDMFGTDDYWASDFDGSFEWIPNLAMGSMGANPEQFDDIIAALESTSNQLIGNYEIMDVQLKIGDTVKTWTGLGAVEFNKFWVNTWSIAQQQGFLVDAAIIALTSNRELLVQARADIYDILWATKVYLEEDSVDGGAVALFVLDLIQAGALAAAPPATGTAAKAAVAVATNIFDKIKSAINTARSEGLKDDEERGASGSFKEAKEAEKVANDFGIGGDNVEQILRLMEEAINEVKKKVDEKELIIADALQEAYDQIEVNGRDMFEAPRPGIIDDSDKKLTGKKGLGDPS